MALFGGSSGGLGFGATITLKDAFTSAATRASKAGIGLLGTLGRLGKTSTVSFGSVGGSIGGAVKSMAGMAAMGGVMYEGVYKPLQLTANLEEQLFNIKAAFLSTGASASFAASETEKIRPAILDIAKEYGPDRAMVAEAIWQAVSSGANDAASAIARVRDVAAGYAAYNINMQDAIALTTDIVSNYGEASGTAAENLSKLVMAQGFGQLTSQEMVGAMRQLLPVGKRAGFGWEEQAAALAGLTMGSGDAAAATTLLKNLLTQLSTVQGRGELAMRMRQIGISIDQAKMKSLGLMGTIQYLKQRAQERAFIRIGVDLPELKMSFKAAELQSAKGAATVALKMAAAMNAAMTKGDSAVVNATLDRLGIVGMGADKFKAMSYRDQAVALGNVLRQKERLIIVDAEAAAAFSSLGDETGQQGKIMVKTLDAMGHSGQVLADALALKKNDPKKNLKQLREEFEQMQIEIGMQMMPMLMNIVGKLQQIDWDKVSRWINRTAQDLSVLPAAVDLAAKDFTDALDGAQRHVEKNWSFWANPINLLVQGIGAHFGFDWETQVKDMNQGLNKVGNHLATGLVKLGGQWKDSLLSPVMPFVDAVGWLENSMNKNRSIWGRWNRESASWTRQQRQDYLAWARIDLTDYGTQFGKLDWHIRAIEDSTNLAFEQLSTVPGLVADGWIDAFRQINQQFDNFVNRNEQANKRTLASTLDLQHKMRIAWGLEKATTAPVPVGATGLTPKPRLFDKPGSEGKDFESLRMSKQEVPLYLDFLKRQRAGFAADAAASGTASGAAGGGGSAPIITALNGLMKSIEKLALRPVAVAIDGRQVATAVLRESDWITSAE